MNSFYNTMFYYLGRTETDGTGEDAAALWSYICGWIAVEEDEQAFEDLIKGWDLVDEADEFVKATAEAIAAALPRLFEIAHGGRPNYRQAICEHEFHPNYGMCVECGLPASERPATPVAASSCDWGIHSWSTYVGFTESYDYCTVCGVKRK